MQASPLYTRVRVSLLAFIFLLGCSSEVPTVTVTIDADDTVRTQTSSLRIVFAGRTIGAAEWSEASPSIFDQTLPEAWPRQKTISPKNGEPKREFQVEASAHDARGTTLVVARARSTFAQLAGREIRLVLTADCLSSLVTCLATQTCSEGQCVDTTVRPDAGTSIPDAGSTISDTGALDAYVPIDAARDAGPDACAPVAVYRDDDGDDFGVASSRLMTCIPVDGYVEQEGDCNDTSNTVRPGTTELCDGIDNNCDMRTDEGCSCTTGTTRACGTDTGECSAGLQRCTAGTWSTTCEGERPSSTETCDTRDNDCDGETDEGLTLVLYRDSDADGFGTTSSSITACPTSGYVTNSSDCNDSSRAINPSATELCDGINNDCDATTDEGCTCVGGTTRACGTDTGECTAGTETCVAGSWTGCSATLSSTEICDGRDNDCDGISDDSATCTARTNTTNTCTSGACRYTCTPNYGDCDSTPTNGCEANLRTSTTHCGRCSNPCTGTCVSGACVPPVDWCTADLCTISSIGEPAARTRHSAIWTGSEMIIWGGFNGSVALNDGARYDPVSNTWTPISNVGAPSIRYDHTAVWADSEMIVWGGASGGTKYADGGRYNLATDTWSSLPTDSSTPTARFGHVAVWSGETMLVWGGQTASGLVKDGAYFFPSLNEWVDMAVSGDPTARVNHSAVWDDGSDEMIVWGGTASLGRVTHGGRYNILIPVWSLFDAAPAGGPDARAQHAAIWTGSTMVVWGGFGGSHITDVFRYNPSADTWSSTVPTASPRTRYEHTAIWTGTRMLVWGGWNGPGPIAEGVLWRLP